MFRNENTLRRAAPGNWTPCVLDLGARIAETSKLVDVETRKSTLGIGDNLRSNVTGS
jgi:hypothetical protein